MRTSFLLGALFSLSLSTVAACGDDTGGSGGGGQGGGGQGGGGEPASTGSTGGEECGESGGGEASVGPCLVAAHAGTYQVTGDHVRGSITIGEDGSIDYDESLQFGIDEYQGVYDRLECCQRISVEMNPRPENDPSLAEGARHRVDVFTDSTTSGGAVVRFEYYPNWPSEDGKVALDVTG